MPAESTYQYTLEDIQRYLSGSMSAAEMHALEKAALNDPLLADALDGYRNVHPSVTTQHLNEIRNQIGNIKQETAAPVVPLSASGTKKWRILAAAILIGFMALGAWLFMRPSEQPLNGGGVAQNTTPSSGGVAMAPSAEKNDSIATPPLPANAVPETSLQEKAVAKTPQKEPPVSNPVPAMAPAREIARTDQRETAAPANDQTITMAESKVLSPPQQSLRKSTAFAEPGLSTGDTELAINNKARIARTSALMIHPTNRYFVGKVLDQNGNPIPGASIIASEDNTTTSNTDGSFRLPANDSVGQLSFIAVGYNNKVEQMLAGKVSGVQLETAENALNDVVVIGNGIRRKKEAYPAAASSFKIDTLPYKESPYPQGGWDHFYDNLTMEMGVNKTTASRDLHLRFTIEDGIPQHFTVVKTPDPATAEKAISIIKKGPKWKANKRKKKVDLKMKVD